MATMTKEKALSFVTSRKTELLKSKRGLEFLDVAIAHPMAFYELYVSEKLKESQFCKKYQISRIQVRNLKAIGRVYTKLAAERKENQNE